MILRPSPAPTAWYWLGIIICFGVLIWFLSGALTPFVAAMAIAYMLDPLADRFERWGLSRAVATTLIMFGFVLFLVLALVVLVPMIEEQLNNFANAVPDYIRQGKALLIKFGGDDVQTLIENPETGLKGQSAGDLAKNVLGWTTGFIRSIWSGSLAVVGFVSLFIITPVVAFYLLLDWHRLVREIDGWLPRREAPIIRHLAHEIDLVISGFVRGQALVCLSLAIYYGTALTLAGVPFGLIVGTVSGLLSFIPYVGSIIGITLAGAIGIIHFWPDPVALGIIAGIFVMGHILEGYILTPYLVGGRVGLHPVWLMFALFAFGTLFGFLGLLLAVPLSAAIGVLARFARDRYLESPLYLGRDPL